MAPAVVPTLEVRSGAASMIAEPAVLCFLRWATSRLPSPRGPVGPAVENAVLFSEDRGFDVLLDFALLLEF